MPREPFRTEQKYGPKNLHIICEGLLPAMATTNFVGGMAFGKLA